MKGQEIIMESVREELINPLGGLRLIVAEAIDEANEAAAVRFFAFGKEMSVRNDRLNAARRADYLLN